MERKRAIGTVAVVLAVVAQLIGCGGSAVAVRRGNWSGELVLHGGVVDAHEAAEMAMAEHCGGRVRVLDPASAARVRALDSGGRVVDAGEDERITYVCVSRAPRALGGETPTYAAHHASESF